MESREKFYLELGRITFKKLDLLAQSNDKNAPELDFFLADGEVIELLNRFSTMKEEKALSSNVSTSQNNSEKRCKYCGKELRSGALFCLGCGKKI